MGRRTCNQPTVEGGRCRNGPGCTVDHKGQMAAFQAGVNSAAAAAAAAGPGGDPFTVRVKCMGGAMNCARPVYDGGGMPLCDVHSRIEEERNRWAGFDESGRRREMVSSTGVSQSPGHERTERCQGFTSTGECTNLTRNPSGLCGRCNGRQ